MKTFRLTTTLRKTLTVFCLGLFTSFSAQAATLDDVVKAINGFQERAVAWLDAFREMYLQHMFEENPSYPATVAANSAVTNANTAVKNTLLELAIPQVQEALTQKNEDQKTRILSALPASDSLPQATSTTPSLFGGQKQNEPSISEGDSRMDFLALVGPVAYKDETEKQKAYDFIQFLSSIAAPVAEINLSTLPAAKREKLQNSDAGRKYLRYTRGLTSEYSVAMDTLNELYARRLLVPELGEQAGLSKDKKDADASALQVEHYLATRRTENPEWYQDMTKAAPATVQREMLATQAEMNRQLYQLHMDNERIIALLSVIVLQNIQTNKVLDRTKIDAARKVISGS